MIDVSQRLANLTPDKLRLLEQRLGTNSQVAEPIAIVGMSCRFAGAANVDDYWRVISEGIDATGEIPASRWNVDAFFDPTGEQIGKMSVRNAGMVADVDKFDAAFFGISPREASRMDPQQRLLLEVAWEALEVAGLAPDRVSGSTTGVFIGIGGTDYSKIHTQDENYFRYIDAHVGTGNALSIAANRVSYVLDLRGPSVALDSACSSSTFGIHTAVQSLRNRECDAALAGGVNLILSPETTIAFSKAHMLSPDGRCRPFDAAANGYVRGEGCALLVLKRLTDATRDGDQVLAIIRASAVNQDGRTSGITAPNGRSQQAVIRAALAQARWTPDQVSYLEAHGTATPLGDPIELEALSQVFRRSGPDDPPCYVSSVKGNIGHTETVSGVAGIIKVVLMMRHGLVPAQLHFQTLNPHVSLDGSRLAVPAQPVDWQRNGQPRAAGVSSFGFGGTNTHILIEEAHWQAPRAEFTDRPCHLLALSAKSEAALSRLVGSYVKRLDEHADAAVADVCYSANTGRCHFHHRLAIVAADSKELRNQLTAVAQGQHPKGVRKRQSKAAASLRTAFLFTGQGSQYVGMGRSLYETQPTYRRAIAQCDEILRPLLPKTLLSVIYPDNGSESPLDETAYTQPALFAHEYALATLWGSWGIQPAVVLGHSVGEYVAACVAGVFSLEDGLRLIACRARLMQQLPRNGRMAVVFADATRVRQALPDVVSIAAINGPDNTVISGHQDAIDAVIEQLALEGISSQALSVSHAFHSHLMEPMLDEFEAFAATVRFNAPKIPLISNLTGAVIDGAPDAAYWRRHVRNPVRFAEGIAAIGAMDMQAVLEIGPTASLTGMARRCLPDSQAAWLPSLRKGHDDWESMLSSLAELYTLGAKVDWMGFDRDWPRRKVILPTYPFEKTRHWFDAVDPIRRSGSGAQGPLIHPLLGARVRAALNSTIFEVRLNSQSPEYLVDHQVQGSPVVPAAAYLEQALAAADQSFGAGNHAVADASFQQAMFLPAGTSRIVQVTVSSEQGGERTFEVSSIPADSENEAGPWTLHACGRLRHADTLAHEAPPLINLDAVRRRMHDRVGQVEFYGQMAARGLAYGPAFRVLDNLMRGDNEALAELNLPAAIRQSMNRYRLHPALGDALFQATAGVVPLEADGSHSTFTYMPAGVRAVRIFGPCEETACVYAVRKSTGEAPSPETVEADVSLTDAAGRVLIRFEGVRVQRVGRAAGEKSIDARDWLYRVNWAPEPVDSRASTIDLEDASQGIATWLVFADRHGVGRELSTVIGDASRVVVITQGEEFGKLPAENGEAVGYRIDPLNEDHYRRLFEEALGAEVSGRTAIVHLWSLDISEPAVPLTNALGCGSVLQLVRQVARLGMARPPELLLVTRGAQQVGDGPTELAAAQSPLWGMGRVIAIEHPDLHCRLVDLDPAGLPVDDGRRLMKETVARSTEDQVAYRHGHRHLARLIRTPEVLPNVSGLPEHQSIFEMDGRPFRLRLFKPGSFDGLRFEPMERRPPAAGQVELAVHASGANFSDVLKVMGLYPGVADAVVPLGIEASGVVTAIGPGVSRLKVGDEVVGVVPYSFASHALTTEYALTHKPAGMSHQQAATLPVTFLTAYYALSKLAHLERGQRVLIHAAAGGVGLAAIQIAQHVGAEVFATAGSNEKREYLRQRGVQHVYSTRTLEFADKIMEVTHREGVDVVLNSLPGDAIAKSLSILRAYGRFLEIGKIDIYQNRMLGLLPFQDNLSYFAIDLDRMLRQRPNAIQALFDDLIGHFSAGHFQPLPYTAFPARDVAGALRFLSQRKNIGKVVVSFTPDSSPREISPATVESSPAGTRIRPDATYLITGGLGALGLQSAQWLAAQGARHVALLSRNDPSLAAVAAIESLRQGGVEVIALSGDVADADSLQSACGKIPAHFPPLRGVIHAAGVLADGIVFDMPLDRLEKAMAPKVNGAWNLHRATLDKPLDFFVLFSSIASVFGSPGQANYAAGNAFLDTLAAYRRSQGLPAIAINWGPWAGQGMAESLRSRGLTPIPATRSFEVLQAFLQTQVTNAVVANVHWNELVRLFAGKTPSLFADLFQAETAGDQRLASGFDADLRRQLLESPPAERQAVMRHHLTAELSRIMGINPQELDIEQPLNSIGMDSLMAMELKTVLESRLGISVPMATFFSGPSVTSLADDAVKSIVGSKTVGGDTNKPVTAAVWSPLVLLKSGGRLPPLFCLHPIGGDVRCYVEMARHFGGDRPIYAVTARGLDGELSPHVSMSEMMVDYAAALRRAHPRGPYHLVGWSTGGIYAYELAHQLISAGGTIGLLAMLDTPPPSVFDDRDLNDEARFLCDYVELCNHILGAQMNVSYATLSAMSHDDAFEAALAEAKKHNMAPAGASVDFIRRFVEVGRSTIRLLQRHMPPVMNHPLHLYVPQEGHILADMTGKELSADRGWRSDLTNHVTIHHAQGDHFSMMTGESAARLAHHLQKLMHSADDAAFGGDLTLG